MSKQAIRNPSEHYLSGDQICFFVLTEPRAPLSFFLREFHSDFQNSIVRKFSPDLRPSLMMAYHIRKREVPVQCSNSGKFTKLLKIIGKYSVMFFDNILCQFYHSPRTSIISETLIIRKQLIIGGRRQRFNRWIFSENDYRIISHDRPVSAGA